MLERGWRSAGTNKPALKHGRQGLSLSSGKGVRRCGETLLGIRDTWILVAQSCSETLLLYQGGFFPFSAAFVLLTVQ